MNFPLHLHPNAKGWLLDSVLAPHLEAFAAYLRRGRYASTTTRNYFADIAHFARWIRQARLHVEQLDEAAIKRFLTQHLPRCDCPAPVMRGRDDLHAACMHLLVVLREAGAVSIPPAPTGSIDKEIAEFDTYMNNARGLSASTRRNHRRNVRRFLVWRFATRPVVISAVRPTEIKKFLAEQLDKCASTGNAVALVGALRAYLRYRSGRGDQVQPLRAAICSPARWSMSTLPRSLTAQEIDRLLAAFPSTLPSRRRGYAMVRCALDLGLRISEIAKLMLSDIDWHNGTLALRRNKSRREDVLPLPATTGRAIADYLRHERPATTNQAVFVRRLAPHDASITVDTVARLIRDAYRRAGLNHGRTHALRHSLARRMVEHGSSIKEVADVLRHRSLNTTLIYAKIDTPRLAAVALPWPGSEQ
jgi:integrase/recombinase XerC